ncbi:hypothetical protein HRbin10_02108 [bacterium HR10]|nr:hypothetical protein HRbin10_02108 [bacterium HR10]
MAWIRIIEEDEATGLLAREYEAARRRAGKVFNIVKVQSLNPAALRAGVQLYLTVMYGESKLSRAERELVATVTSWANRCFY